MALSAILQVDPSDVLWPTSPVFSEEREFDFPGSSSYSSSVNESPRLLNLFSLASSCLLRLLGTSMLLILVAIDKNPLQLTELLSLLLVPGRSLYGCTGCALCRCSGRFSAFPVCSSPTQATP